MTDEKRTSSSPQAEEGEDPWCECNKDCFRKHVFQVNVYWRTLGLAVILSIYLLIGAAVFQALEQPNERKENEAIAKSSEMYTQLLENFTTIVSNSTNLTHQEIIDTITNLTTASLGATATESHNWEFASSLFFVITVVTTIGVYRTHFCPSYTNMYTSFFVVL